MQDEQAIRQIFFIDMEYVGPEYYITSSEHTSFSGNIFETGQSITIMEL